ncbi:class I SAM-dependent methyltransferase [Rhizobium sp. YIM 134829]|uniref:class I SAM-dependent methyltransferase n=1 Tax=Rhizobium sp. YIM 134829 TaxID=3390453 RepID=UPI00397AAA72
MLTEENLQLVLDAVSRTIPAGQILLVGFPPYAARRLREMGYEVDGEPIFYDWRSHNIRASKRYRSVVLGIFDENLANYRWDAALEDASFRAIQNICFIAYVGSSAVAKRAAIEDFAYRKDLRKHPGYYSVVPYHALDSERDFIIIPLQHLPKNAADAYPIAALMDKRKLHMDMSREYGRRSDGHIFRYALASNFIRAGDVVLDAACGMGYGAWVMASTTRASKVIGLDIDDEAVRYATAIFADDMSDRLGYQQGDVQDLSRFADNSIDFIASFETVEHIEDPLGFFAEARRVLRPGGRIMVSVPNLWVDETGRDPNPFHLHVYDWQRLHREMTQFFLPERAIGQTAGGGFKHFGHGRWTGEASFTADLSIDSEWCLAVGMKTPLLETVPSFEQFNYRHMPSADWQLTRFAEQYENPWLIPALVQHGKLRPWRLSDRQVRTDVARQALDRHPAGTADHAACLAVLGHAALEDLTVDVTDSAALIESIDTHLSSVEKQSPIMVRWEISLLFLKGLLHEVSGEAEAAYGAFHACAQRSPLDFAPSIATKTIGALYRCGRFHFMRRDTEAAGEAWRRGVAVCRDALSKSSWDSIVGSEAAPDAVGLFEMMDVVNIAQQCAAALEAMGHSDSPPTSFWSVVNNTKDGWLRSEAQRVLRLEDELRRKAHFERLALEALHTSLT